MRRRTWNDNQLVEAVKNNFSIRAVLTALSLNATGANYKSIQSHIKRLGLDDKHLTGRGHLAGKSHSWSPKKEIEDILVEDCNYQTSRLKKRLVAENMLLDECSECGISHWQGRKLSLHLDHINGESTDNRINNLRLLCPNCHSLTDTFAGKNVANKNRAKRNVIIDSIHGPAFALIKSNQIVNKSLIACLDCGGVISARCTRCRSCFKKFFDAEKLTKINWPSTEELIHLIQQSSITKVASDLNVSRTAVRNRINNYPIE